MTAMTVLPLALIVGLAVGWGRWQLVGVALVWYAALAWQTAFIATAGQTAFGGKAGLETVHWWVYWALQPILFVVAVGLVWAGSHLHDRIGNAIRNRTTLAPRR